MSLQPDNEVASDRENNTIRLELPASFKFLNVVGACINEVLQRSEKLNNRELVSYNLQLAVHEICTNIVEHAYEGLDNGRIRIAFFLDENANTLTVDLEDNGRNFDPNLVKEPNLDEGQVHGYGLFLAKSLVDNLTYLPGKGGNYWKLFKNL